MASWASDGLWNDKHLVASVVSSLCGLPPPAKGPVQLGSYMRMMKHARTDSAGGSLATMSWHPGPNGSHFFCQIEVRAVY